MDDNFCKKTGFARRASGALAFLCAAMLLLSGCASKATDAAAPLWASYDTIEAVYPNAQFIARIGYGSTGELAASLAESELGSYFSHSVHSITEGRQTLSESKSSARKTSNGAASLDGAQVSRSIERTVTVESLQTLFDVHKTPVWFDRAQKRYVCCAYIDRATAWKIYEGVVRDSWNKFHIYYDTAAAEKEPLRKMSLLSAPACEQSASGFLDTLEMARLIFPGKENAFAADRKLAESLELEKEAARMNAVMFVSASNDDGNSLTRLVSSLISSQGLIITTKKNEAVYDVIIDLDFGKTEHGDTITAEPGIKVVIRNMSTAKSVWTYNKNLPRQSGFSAAEALLNRKIFSSAQDELQSSFVAEFTQML